MITIKTIVLLPLAEPGRTLLPFAEFPSHTVLTTVLTGTNSYGNNDLVDLFFFLNDQTIPL